MLIVGFALFLFLPKCTSEVQYKPKPVINIQTIINDELLKLDIKNAKKDSAINARNIQMRKDSINLIAQVTKYKNAYYKAIKIAPDTCKTYINTIYQDCNKVDSIHAVYALKQDSTIKDQEQQKQNLKMQVAKKDLIIGVKNDSLNIMKFNNEQLNKTNNKKELASWFKLSGGLLFGFVAGRGSK